ncbi:MAG TPA: magnesium transporter [Sphingomonas sp.]|nr:magnesium transporter [Sphingomonas sp.]
MPLPGGGGTDLFHYARRPSILLLGAAAVGVVANALALAAPLQSDAAPPSRLGVSLQDGMAQRDRTLAEEKRKLDMREQAAKAGEARLAAEMRARQGQPGGVDPQRGAPVEANQPYDDLARIYQTMKPARAAPIFEKLDLEVQTQVARRMRERSAALLMAAMSPNAAAELTMSLAGRKVIQQRPQTAVRSAPSRPRSSPAGGPPTAGK